MMIKIRLAYGYLLSIFNVLSIGMVHQVDGATISYVYAGKVRVARSVDNEQLQSYVADNKGSVLNLVDGVTPVAGVSYQYDAYGLALKSPAMNIPNPFQYNGEWTDNFSQLQYLRARFYHPKLMRFVQQDSVDLANRFNYGDGNPIVNSDPSGHFSVLPNIIYAGGGLFFDVVSYYLCQGNRYMIFSAGFINSFGQITDIALLSGGVIKQEGTVDKIIVFGSFFSSMALAIGSVYVSNLRRSRLLYDNPGREIRLLLRANNAQLAPPPVVNEILENPTDKIRKFEQIVQATKQDEIELGKFLQRYGSERDLMTTWEFNIEAKADQKILMHKGVDGGVWHPVLFVTENRPLVEVLASRGCLGCRTAYTKENTVLWKLIEDHIDSRL